MIFFTFHLKELHVHAFYIFLLPNGTYFNFPKNSFAVFDDISLDLMDAKQIHVRNIYSAIIKAGVFL